VYARKTASARTVSGSSVHTSATTEASVVRTHSVTSTSAPAVTSGRGRHARSDDVSTTVQGMESALK